MNTVNARGYISPNLEELFQIEEYCADKNFKSITNYTDLQDLINDTRKNDHVIIPDLFLLKIVPFSYLMEECNKKKARVICLSHPDIDANESNSNYFLTSLLAFRDLEKSTR
jgi:hypothetical protein